MTKSSDWVTRSQRVVWHPCSQMQHHEQFPLIPIARGQGCWLYGPNNERYLDVISSWWVNLFGHGHPSINSAIIQQLQQLEHVMLAGFTHEPVIQLSERLLSRAPTQAGISPLQHCIYASDGASATEISIKLACHYWRNLGQPSKQRIIHLSHSYHGETLGALSVTDLSLFRQAYQHLLSTHFRVPSPDPRYRPIDCSPEEWLKQCISDLQSLLITQGDQIAAMIIEPLVQCATGMGMYSVEYLKQARQLCAQHNVLFIADEIAVGMGRTGTFFACEQAQIQPDCILLSKGITGGYLPLSVVLCTENIYQAFYDHSVEKGFLHSHSYTGNPLACAAALAVLTLFEEHDVLQRNRVLAQQANLIFKPLRDHSFIENWRQCGMIWAFDVLHTQNTPWSSNFFQLALTHGLLIRPIGRTVYFMPPYTILPEELEFLCHQILACLEKGALHA